MKKIKTLPLILALIFVLALPMGVFATGENAKITISAPDSLVLAANDFSAYKLFDVTVSGSGSNTNYAYTPVQPAVNNFLAWATANAAPSPYGTTAAAFKTWLEGARSAAELKKLTKDLKDSGAFTAVGTRTKVGANVEISGLDYGYYLVAGEGAPTAGGDKVIAHSTLVTVDSANTPIRLKADAPGIEKFVSDQNLSIGASGWGKQTDANIGDTVYFKLNSKVPEMTGYDSYTFIVHDTMSKGLTFNNNSVAIVLTNPSGTGSITLPGSSYTVNSTPIASGPSAGGAAITITFTNLLQYINNAGWNIVITYNAVLNENAVLAPNGNPNEVNLEYSNDPYTGGTGTTPDDEVVVYTFDLRINKVDGRTGAALGGAVFELRNTAGNAASAKAFKLENAGSSTTPAVYVVSSGGAGTTTDLIVPASGIVYIKGLKSGTYSLYEKVAPSGYNLLTEETPVVISHTVSGGNSNYVTLEVEVENNSGFKLPGTGGVGTTIFYIVGLFLTIGLITFIIAYKRRNLLKAK